jgi:hypothetical protein
MHTPDEVFQMSTNAKPGIQTWEHMNVGLPNSSQKRELELRKSADAWRHASCMHAPVGVLLLNALHRYLLRGRLIHGC